MYKIVIPLVRGWNTLVTGVNSAERTIVNMQTRMMVEEEKRVLVLSERENIEESWSVRYAERSELDNSFIHKARKKSKRANLNVGGVKHEVMWKMLEQVPTSRLGKLAKATTVSEIVDFCADYSPEHDEYFFDRHPRSFNTILAFYRTGKLHIQDGICHLAFCEDLSYWQLDELCVETCCIHKYKNRKEEILMQMEAQSELLKKDDEEVFWEGCIGKAQKTLWDTMEKPEVSLAAKLVSVTSLIFVVISTAGMCLNTLPSLQGVDEQGNPTDNVVLTVLETLSVIWFTMEYFLRFIGCPEKCKFLKSTMNALDVAAVLPFYVPLMISLLEDEESEGSFPQIVTNSWEIPSSSENLPSWQTPAYTSHISTKTLPDLDYATKEKRPGSSIDDVLQVFKIFKLIRLAKIARHSTGLQAIGVTLMNSYKELGLLLMLIVIAGLLFSSMIYFIEVAEEDSSFYSIPNAFWWSVITMTTVGYGDMQPTTGLGKLVGTMCAVSGVLVMSLPIPIIVSNFEAFYANTKKFEASKVRKARLLDEKQSEYEERVKELLEDKDKNILSNDKLNHVVKTATTEFRDESDEDADDTFSEDTALLPERYKPRHTQSLADIF